MLSKKSGARTYYLFIFFGFLFLSLNTQGCAMPDAEVTEVQLIQRILLKPTDKITTNSRGELSVGYLNYLRSALKPKPAHGGQNEAGGDVVELSYIHPMSGGVHVLQIEPAIRREAAVTLANTLTALDDVEYAEPDFPRRRR